MRHTRPAKNTCPDLFISGFFTDTNIAITPVDRSLDGIGLFRPYNGAPLRILGLCLRLTESRHHLLLRDHPPLPPNQPPSSFTSTLQQHSLFASQAGGGRPPSPPSNHPTKQQLVHNSLNNNKNVILLHHPYRHKIALPDPPWHRRARRGLRRRLPHLPRSQELLPRARAAASGLARRGPTPPAEPPEQLWSAEAWNDGAGAARRWAAKCECNAERYMGYAAATGQPATSVWDPSSAATAAGAVSWC